MIRIVISVAAIIASCNASVGHILPAVRSVPIVRYAPFYNFPNGVRSIHTVSAPVAFAPAPAVAQAPLLPAPISVAPAPASVFPAPAPLFPAPAPGFAAPSPIYPAPAAVFPAPASIFPPFYQRIGAIAPAPLLTRSVPALPAVPFSPIVRPVAAPVPAPLFTPAVAPAPTGITRAVPFSISPYAPAPFAHTPILKQFAWK